MSPRSFAFQAVAYVRLVVKLLAKVMFGPRRLCAHSDLDDNAQSASSGFLLGLVVFRPSQAGHCPLILLSPGLFGCLVCFWSLFVPDFVPISSRLGALSLNVALCSRQ